MQYSLKSIHNSKGFTLVEIMIVVVILGILAAFVVPKVMDRPDQARITKAKNDIASLGAALNLYKLDNFSYPDTDQGLEALVTVPENAAAWKDGGYIEKLPKDPWNQEYIYTFPGENGSNFDIISYGADRRPGGTGVNADISNNDR